MDLLVIPNVYHSGSSLDGYAVVSTGQAKLLGFVAENTSGSTRWVQVFDATAEPSNGTVPLLSIKVLAGTQISFDISVSRSMQLYQGLVLTSSSTGPTYTSVTADTFFTVFWID